MDSLIESALLSLTSSPKEAGYLLFHIHFMIILCLPVIFLFFPILRIPIMCVWVPFFTYHIVYKKCPLTKIERRLHGEDITIIDLFLNPLGLPVTRASRDFMHVTMSALFMSLMGISYVFKFP